MVERLWPRGLSKERAKLDLWLKDVAPSHELRRWFDHDPAKWEEFKKRYFAELATCQEPIASIRQRERSGVVTFVFAARELRFNNAVALAEYLEFAP